MVKRCSYGLCNNDSRYPERLVGGIRFVPFPKPKKKLDKCLRWIRACGRPHSQLNPGLINSNRYVCTKHFVNQCWPTTEFPDPIPSDSCREILKPIRKPPLQRQNPITTQVVEEVVAAVCEGDSSNVRDSSMQTCSSWVEPMDLVVLVAENEALKRDLAKSSLLQLGILREAENAKENTPPPKEVASRFSVTDVIENSVLMKYYSGFNKVAFKAILTFLVPNEGVCPLTYIGKGNNNLSQARQLSLENQLFLTLCKLRNNFDMQDLGFRFGLTQQATSVIFNSWITYMFLRFGELCIWPPRNVISEKMPKDYKQEFPSTFVIVDCTELKIQKPSSLKTQSQTYSDYKSCNTLKALVAVDPRGSVIYSSMLFAGAMSDKEIFKQSGFKETLEQLIKLGYLNRGDGIMGDKGFDIDQEVQDTGLRLNIPPFAKSGTQMNAQDVVLTQKIAKHRVHVERAIRRIKSFKILSGRIALSMQSSIDQIWYVCSVLTNFMPMCIKKE